MKRSATVAFCAFLSTLCRRSRTTFFSIPRSQISHPQHQKLQFCVRRVLLAQAARIDNGAHSSAEAAVAATSSWEAYRVAIDVYCLLWHVRTDSNHVLLVSLLHDKVAVHYRSPAGRLLSEINKMSDSNFVTTRMTLCDNVSSTLRVCVCVCVYRCVNG